MITRVDGLVAKAANLLGSQVSEEEYEALCLYRDKLAHDQLSILAAAREEGRQEGRQE